LSSLKETKSKFERMKRMS